MRFTAPWAIQAITLLMIAGGASGAPHSRWLGEVEGPEIVIEEHIVIGNGSDPFTVYRLPGSSERNLCEFYGPSGNLISGFDSLSTASGTADTYMLYTKASEGGFTLFSRRLYSNDDIEIGRLPGHQRPVRIESDFDLNRIVVETATSSMYLIDPGGGNSPEYWMRLTNLSNETQPWALSHYDDWFCHAELASGTRYDMHFGPADVNALLTTLTDVAFAGTIDRLSILPAEPNVTRLAASVVSDDGTSSIQILSPGATPNLETVYTAPEAFTITAIAAQANGNISVLVNDNTPDNGWRAVELSNESGTWQDQMIEGNSDYQTGGISPDGKWVTVTTQEGTLTIDFEDHSTSYQNRPPSTLRPYSRVDLAQSSGHIYYEAESFQIPYMAVITQKLGGGTPQIIDSYNSGESMFPRASADGKSILYLKQTPGSTANTLYVAAMDGSSPPVEIGEHFGYGGAINTLDPAGEWSLFLRNYGRELWTLNIETLSLTQLAGNSTGISFGGFAQNGQSIMFTDYSGNYFLSPVDGSRAPIQFLDTAVDRFTLNPDGNWCCYLIDDVLYSMELAPPYLAQQLATGVSTTSLKFTETSSYVVYLTGGGDIMSVPTDGSAAAQVIAAPSSSTYTIDDYQLRTFGDTVTYVEDSSSWHQLYSVPADGASSPTALVTRGEPPYIGLSLSGPYLGAYDGHIVFGSASSYSDSAFYSVPLDGSEAPKKLVQKEGGSRLIKSHDGDAVVVLSDYGLGRYNLYYQSVVSPTAEPAQINISPVSTQYKAQSMSANDDLSIIVGHGNIGSSSQPYVIYRDDPLEDWRSGYFSASSISNADYWGDDADPNGNGLTNYMDFLLGNDPVSNPSTNREPELRISCLSDGPGMFRLQHPIGETASVSEWVPMISFDLLSWEPASHYFNSYKTTQEGQSVIRFETNSSLNFDSAFFNVLPNRSYTGD